MPNDALGAVAELAASQHGVVTRSKAAELGLTTRQVRRLLVGGLLTEPAPGVLAIRGAPDSWHRAATVASLALGQRGVLSHRAAGFLHGLDGLDPEPPMEVSVPRGVRPVLPGVVVHQVRDLPRADRFEIDGLAVTGLARTLADRGTVVGSDRVLQALDDARRRGSSLRWIRETAERLHRHGQRGTTVLLTFLDQIDAGDAVVPGSWFNRLIERCLVSPKLPTIEREFEIRDDKGDFVARVDLAMPDIKLGVEGHSRRFHIGSVAEAADEDRDLRIATCGWEVLYLGWHAHRRPATLLAMVERVAATRMAA